MPEALPQVIHKIAVVDEPGGVIDRYIESFQLEHLNITSHIARGASITANSQEIGDMQSSLYPSDYVLRLVTVPTGPLPLQDLAATMTGPGLTLVFTHDYVNSSYPNVRVQGIPAGSVSEFEAKVGGHIARIIRGQPPGSPMNPPFEEFPEAARSYPSLAAYAPILNERHSVRVVQNDVNYDFFSDLRSGSKRLVVFGQSAISRKNASLPVFHRWKWMLDLEGSAIALNDPTLYLDDHLDAGWWVGTLGRDYVMEAVEIVLKIAASLEIESKNIIFYGGSAGGFSSFQMAACLPGSRVVADIPQIDLRKYHLPRAIDAAVHAGLGYPSSHEVPLEYLHRIDVLERFIRNEHIPDFLYLQNLRDATHVDDHFGDFRTRVQKLIDVHSWARPVATYRTYSAWSIVRGGHFPLGRWDTMKYLNDY